MTTDQIVGLVCIVAGLLVPAAVIAWASARETLREARERYADAPMTAIVAGPDAEDDR